jgi:Ca2+-binding EF-hand superfamily protein
MKAIAEKLKALFSSADQTGGTSGKVVVDEARNSSGQLVREAIRKASSGGELSEMEFKFRFKWDDMEKLMRGAGIFHMFDKDGSGKVEWNELLELDTDGDGQISLQEFLDGWQKKVDAEATESQDTEVTTVTTKVSLTKQDGQKLGFNLATNPDGDGLVISKVVKASMSDGKFKVGDVVTDVNGIDVTVDGGLKKARVSIKENDTILLTVEEKHIKLANKVGQHIQEQVGRLEKPLPPASPIRKAPSLAQNLKKLFAKADVSDGTVTFGSAQPDQMLDRTELAHRLDVKQLIALLKEAGVLHKLNGKHKIESIVQQMDTNRDGKVSIEEFLQFAAIPAGDESPKRNMPQPAAISKVAKASRSGGNYSPKVNQKKVLVERFESSTDDPRVRVDEDGDGAWPINVLTTVVKAATASAKPVKLTASPDRVDRVSVLDNHDVAPVLRRGSSNVSLRTAMNMFEGAGVAREMVKSSGKQHYMEQHSETDVQTHQTHNDLDGVLTEV